jgi:tetratricopeptide (TPR) repeat protein
MPLLLHHRAPPTTTTRHPQAIFLAPKDPTLHEVMADVVLSVGDIKSAIAHMRRACNLAQRLEESPQRPGKPENRSHAIQYRLAGMLDGFGSLEYRRGAFETALAYFSDAVALQEPVSAAVYIHRAMAQVQLGNWTTALGDLEHARFLAPPMPEQLVLQAKLCEMLGHSEESLNCFRQAEELMPEHADVSTFRARVDENIEAVYREASTHMLARDYVSAKTALKAILVINHKDAKARTLLAAACRALGQYSEGLEHLAVASDMHHRIHERRRSSADHRWHNAHGTERKQVASVMSKSKSKTRNDGGEVSTPRDTSTTDGLSANSSDDEQSQDLPDDDDDASSSAAAGTSGGCPVPTTSEPPELVKQRCLIFNDMALAEIEAGELNAAVLLLNRALSTQRHQPHAIPADLCRTLRINRGDCYRSLGKLDVALADYHYAMESHPHATHIRTRLSVVHNSKGVDLRNAGETERAQAEFAKAIEFNDSVAEYHFNVGVVSEDQGDLKNAFLCYKRALSLDPDHELAKTRISQFH